MFPSSFFFGVSTDKEAVNATLSQTTPTSPTSLKRPAPEDGEIADTNTNTTITTPAEQKPAESILGRIQGAATGNATATGPRVIKRPRGSAPRGGAARRASGPGGGSGAGAGGGTGST